ERSVRVRFPSSAPLAGFPRNLLFDCVYPVLVTAIRPAYIGADILPEHLMTSALFQPIKLGNLAVPNRLAVAPMCQYSADDGSANDWHLQHWMNLGMSGAGMVTVEMTNVERRGRISHG